MVVVIVLIGSVILYLYKTDYPFCQDRFALWPDPLKLMIIYYLVNNLDKFKSACYCNPVPRVLSCYVYLSCDGDEVAEIIEIPISAGVCVYLWLGGG